MVATLLLYAITPFELKTRANDNKEKLQEEYRQTTAENDSHHFAIPSFPGSKWCLAKGSVHKEDCCQEEARFQEAKRRDYVETAHVGLPLEAEGMHEPVPASHQWQQQKLPHAPKHGQQDEDDTDYP